MSSDWTCPYCDRDQTGIAENKVYIQNMIRLENVADGPFYYSLFAIRCANRNCRKMTLTFCLRQQTKDKKVRVWNLLPDSHAKPQPDYIPQAIRADYYEACRIRDLSPKASATLVRRCLQGMIRDFCRISKDRLIDEIRELRAALDEGRAPAGVTAESVDAIDRVRKIGNIGAHMEKDINLIVDVEPGEAQLLIGLVELLFKEWYVAREDRRVRLATLDQLAADKEAERQQARPASPAKEVRAAVAAAQES